MDSQPSHLKSSNVVEGDQDVAGYHRYHNYTIYRPSPYSSDSQNDKAVEYNLFMVSWFWVTSEIYENLRIIMNVGTLREDLHVLLPLKEVTSSNKSGQIHS